VNIFHINNTSAQSIVDDPIMIPIHCFRHLSVLAKANDEPRAAPELGSHREGRPGHVRAEATSNRDALFLKNTHTQRETATLVGASTSASPSLPATVGSRAWAARPAAPPPRLHRLSSTSAGATRAHAARSSPLCGLIPSSLRGRGGGGTSARPPLLALEQHRSGGPSWGSVG